MNEVPRRLATSPHAPPVIVAYRDGKVRENLPFDDVDRELEQPGGLVWIDLLCPTTEEIDNLQQELSLHPLAVEDIRAPHQRPKVDTYETSCLVVLFAAHLDERARLHLSQVAIFIGAGYLVTVHEVPLPSLDAVRARLLADVKAVQHEPLGFLLYRISRALVEGYFPVVDALDERIEHVEDRLFHRLRPVILRDILTIRRDLVELRRAIAPQRDVFTTLARHEDLEIGAAADPYFTDLVDYTLRLTDTVDTMRDRLGTALDSYLTLQSNALNETMKRLTALTVVVSIPMIVSGIYGMNFAVMPLLNWEFGFWFALALTVVLMGACWWGMRRLGWF